MTDKLSFGNFDIAASVPFNLDSLKHARTKAMFGDQVTELLNKVGNPVNVSPEFKMAPKSISAEAITANTTSLV